MSKTVEKTCKKCGELFKQTCHKQCHPFFYCETCRSSLRKRNKNNFFCLFCKAELTKNRGSRFCNETCALNFDLQRFSERRQKLLDSALIKVSPNQNENCKDLV
jgi:hypothetical protein